jgi:hypothetical protein
MAPSVLCWSSNSKHLKTDLMKWNEEEFGDVAGWKNQLLDKHPALDGDRGG